MVGACPVLRVLVQDMRSSGRHYPTTEDPSQLPDPTWGGWKFDDESSEKGIFHTQEALVESRQHERGHGLDRGHGHELMPIRPSR